MVQTDASYSGVGAVLSTTREGQERPIAYFSKRLSSAERNYAASEIECLAVVRAVDQFAIHLLGKPFVIMTDHKALTSLLTSKRLNGRLMRWALLLQDFTFEIVHRAGNLHGNADGLSRQDWPSSPLTPPRGGVSAQEGGDVGPHPQGGARHLEQVRLLHK